MFAKGEPEGAANTSPLEHNMLKPYITLLTYLQTRRDDERGASAVEYGLLVAAIAAAIVVIVFLLGDVITEVFTDTCTEVSTGAGTAATC